jgi:hypothetical protein
MKGVEDFIYLLVAAIVVVIALVGFSQFFNIVPLEAEDSVIEEFSLGVVGFSQDVASETISLGTLKVGETQEEALKKVLEVKVSRGVASGEDEEFTVNVPSYLQDLIKGVRVTWVTDISSNPVGNMRIVWNGKLVYNGKPSGRVVFDIDKEYVVEENNVKVTADGPGLAFWDSTIYVLRDFEVKLLYGPQRIFSFTLTPNELQIFNKGEVGFFGSGSNLDIKVNGVQIYSKSPAGSEKVEFDINSVPINSGNNIVAFISPQGATLSGAYIKVFLLGNQLKKLRSFSLDQVQLDQLAQGWKGKVIFNVNKFIKSGILSVKINGNELDIQTVQKGDNTIYFGLDDVVLGKNSMEFSGTGSWEIDSVKVALSPL